MTGVAPTLTDCSMIRSVCTSQGSNWGKKPIAIAHLGSRDGSLNGHTYQLCTAWSLTHSHTHETNLLVSDSQILSHTHWLLIAGQEVWADFVQDSRWNCSPTCRKHSLVTDQILGFSILELTWQDVGTATGLVWLILPYHLIISNNLLWTSWSLEAWCPLLKCGLTNYLCGHPGS